MNLTMRYLALRLLVPVMLSTALLLAGQFSAQAQEPEGTVTGLSISSVKAGELSITWNAPTLAPTDYRISWAPSNEGFPSYRDTDGNAYPKTASHKVTGLSPGAYKVRVRARYYQGRHVNTPWSGPWAQGGPVSLAVGTTPTQEPNPEQTPGPTAVPEGSITNLTLSSDEPGDLWIRWDEADPVPEQYRITWARADEDFHPWTEDNWNYWHDDNARHFSSLDRGESYKFKVRAVYKPADAAPWSGPWSPIKEQRVDADVPPAPPTGLEAEDVRYDKVSLVWDDIDDDRITGYQVLRGADADSLAVIARVTGNSVNEYLDTEVADESSYVYAVMAVSLDGSSARSNPVSVTTPAELALTPDTPVVPGAPEAPSALAARLNGNSGVVLNWADPNDPAITGYRILRGPDSGHLAIIEEDTGLAGTSYTDAAPAADETYVYGVQARNASGLSQLSNSASVRTLSGPTGLRASPSSGHVALTWDLSPNRGIAGYRVLRGVAADSLTVLVANTGSPDPQYVDTSVAVGTEYRYAVGALSSNGAGPLSETAQATTPRAPAVVLVDVVEEDPPIAQKQETETIAVSNLGKASNTEIYIRGGRAIALSFSTGTTKYVLRKIRGNMNSVGGALIELFLYSDDTGTPGSQLLSLGGPDSPHLNRPGHVGDYQGLFGSGYDDFSTGEFVLGASTTYWVVFQERSRGTGTVRTRDTRSTDEDGGAIDGWSIGDVSYNRTSATADFEESGVSYFPVMAIIVNDLTVLTDTIIRSKPLDGETYKAGENIEVEFVFSAPVAHVKGTLTLQTADIERSAEYVAGSGTNRLLYQYKINEGDKDDDGFSIKQSGLGTINQKNITTTNGGVVDVNLSSQHAGPGHKVDGSQIGCAYLLCTNVTVADVGGGTAYGAVYYRTGPLGSLSNRTFHHGDSQYVVDQLIVRDPDQLEIYINPPPTQQLIDEASLVTDATEYRFRDATLNGNRLSWSGSGQSWTADTMVRVHLKDKTLASNLGKEPSQQSLETSTTVTAYAQSFTTGDDPHGYRIVAVKLASALTAESAVPRLAIYSDASGVPGAIQHILSAPTTDNDPATIERFTSSGFGLEPHTKYWLAWEKLSGAGELKAGFTTHTNEDPTTASGWAIGDSVQQKNSGTWSELIISGDNPVMRMAILGDPRQPIGEITGLKAYNGIEPYEIELHWNPAYPVPTDYRIDFAPSNQDFTSWKVDEGHRYSPTTATSAGFHFEHCHAWKIRIRARYYAGRWANPPWSGEWVTSGPFNPPCIAASATAPPPPGEPTLPPDGSVTLTVDTDRAHELYPHWTAANPTPSRYRVMWLKADRDWATWRESGGHSFLHDWIPGTRGLPGEEEVLGLILAGSLVETGVAYNVRVRAVYDSGGTNDGPWSGPWDEVGPVTVPSS